MTEQKKPRKKKTFRKNKGGKKEIKQQYVAHTTFTFEEIITPEEKMIMMGVANGQEFDAKDINFQLLKAREVNR